MFSIQRLGTIMEGLPDDPNEAWGVLNPAAVRGPDGELYLFPRIVAAGNYSRIGIARVRFSPEGVPVGVERLGYALEPSAGFELNERSGGGVEDPRVTFVEPLGQYMMTYTAYSPVGPRIALAVSKDLLNWERLGLAHFAYDPQYRTELELYPNKDALIFPEAIRDPHGNPALAMIHRPSFELWEHAKPSYRVTPPGIADERASMWLSYCPLETGSHAHATHTFYHDHHLLATPQYEWESLKIGGGTPPVRTHLGWLVLHHGVQGSIDPGVDLQRGVYYSAGLMILDADDPRKVLYRSTVPLMKPETAAEAEGIVNNVVFPTAVDVRDERTVDVYYGMADARIGAARLTLPDTLLEA